MLSLADIDLAARRPAPTRRQPSSRQPSSRQPSSRKPSTTSAGGYTSTTDPHTGKVTRRRIRRAGNFVLKYYYR